MTTDHMTFQGPSNSQTIKKLLTMHVLIIIIFKRKATNSKTTCKHIKLMILISVFHNKLKTKLSWCWKSRATRLDVSQGHQT